MSNSIRPIRVRAPHRHGGLLLLAVVLGIVGAGVADGVGMRLAPLLLLVLPATAPSARLVELVSGTGAMLVPMFYGLFLARCCQHPRALFGIGFVVVVIQVVGQALLVTLLDVAPWPGTLRAVVALGGAGLLGGIVYVALGRFYSAVRSRQVDQDGTLCAGCGYPVVGLIGPCCPECGVALDAPTAPPGGRVYRLAEWLRARRTRTVVVLALVGVAMGSAVVWQRLPLWRFTDQFARFGVTPVWFFAGSRATRLARSVIVPSPDDSGRAVMVVAFRERPWAPFRAEAVLVAVSNGQAVEGRFKVRIRFSPGATARLTREGLPSAMWPWLIEEATARGWTSKVDPALAGAVVDLDATALIEGKDQ